VPVISAPPAWLQHGQVDGTSLLAERYSAWLAVCRDLYWAAADEELGAGCSRKYNLLSE
jgi:hypothetical protein